MNLPKYVMMGGRTALRLLSDGTYHRDAGEWQVGCKVVDGKLLSVDIYGQHPQLNGKELIEIDEATWKEDNLGYV